MGITTAKGLDDLDDMTPAQEHRFMSELFFDDGSAARQHLAEGRSVYYSKDDTPVDCVLKKNSDGTIQLVSFPNGVETVIEQILS